MRKHLHTIALVLFLLVFAIDLALWGAVPGLPDVGPHIERSANSEAMLASLYMSLGVPLDGFLSFLGDFGTRVMTRGLEGSFAQILEAPNLAMDLVLNGSYNSTHGWIKTLYWASPVLLVLFLILWALKPKTVSLIRKR
ncbi:MAG TPA: hypothetical protein PKC03_05045 [Dokdonella sp.]|jgi:hypothetical protein|nr:hypothetical protein [Dokdonella sp.]